MTSDQRRPAPGFGKKEVNPNRPQQGLAARLLAHRLIAGVLVDRKSLDGLLAKEFSSPDAGKLDTRDRAFARSIASTVLRRRGELEHVLQAFLDRPLPERAQGVHTILLAGAAQILCLETPPHAAVGLAVEAVRRQRNGSQYAGLTNAILRRVAAEGPSILKGLDHGDANIPSWLLQRWYTAYGPDMARRIGEASLKEASLDISLKRQADADAWAKRLDALVLPTGSLRRNAEGRVEGLPGYEEGEWWVQDAAAALVVRAAGNVAGKTVADLCAAPGGKTAQLVSAAGIVTAVDVSQKRLQRLEANLKRLRLAAEVMKADVATWAPARRFDVVVLDAPCSATGTIRRHPDILHIRGEDDIRRLTALQAELLENAGQLVQRGGILVYSTCSLEADEGPVQVQQFLDHHAEFERLPIGSSEIGGVPEWITPAGEIRTLPFHMRMERAEMSGMDGFFIARLRRNI